MTESLLNDWPCYRRGHKFDKTEFSRAYQKRVLGENVTLRCTRCAREVEFENIQNPISNLASVQNALFIEPFCHTIHNF
jgi:hypothetical protein